MEDRFETFTILISRINRSIRKIKNQEMADWGLKSIHVSCLHYLRSQGSLTAAELCERCEEDKAAVSRAIDHLKSEGFIEASTNGAKPYKCPLVLTKKGEQAGDGQQGYHGAEGNDQPVPHAMPSTTRSWVTSVPEPS